MSGAIQGYCDALLMENVVALGRGQKAKILWRYIVSTILWIIMLEISNQHFGKKREESNSYMWV